MEGSDIFFGTVMLTQISIGLSVNVFLLLFYINVVSASHKLSSSDLIIAHLALANIILLLSGGIPETLSSWGMRNFLDEFGCKILMYLYRVARSLAICTTCLLSVFQAITISPGTWWAEVKAKLYKCIIPSCLLFWVFSLLMGKAALLYITGPRNNSSVQVVFDLKYCSAIPMSAKLTLINAVVISAWDVFFVGLMSLASGYMVFVLHRHHRQVRHLHGPGRSPKAMPEVRAAKRVVALVTLYVLLYGRQTITFSILLNRRETSPLLMSSHVLWAPTFSTVSPFLVIHGDQRMRLFRKKEPLISNPDAS
ncbi:vomeronasal 1 receptor ornAnaV1R3013 [Ornithorhynchus anatinus]|uniref:Vomeronasal type-1 receptor n=1 Tax=Ornithorhynchus anatinus TaxID=9258 RepID=F6RJC5_ORNAN|nr:vomeronasal 1 receptor ornAnaV1R3013 [Ornithorhynchus anatinus]